LCSREARLSTIECSYCDPGGGKEVGMFRGGDE